MTCSVCKYYFCYICNGPVHQCYCDVVPVRSKWLRMLGYLFIATLFFMAIPMLLLLITPMALTIFVFAKIQDEYRYSFDGFKWLCAVPGFMYLMYTGCLLNLIAIPIILTVGPFLLCFALYKFYEDQQ